MNQISLRDFQLRANDFLTKLPLALTRYGKVVAILHAPNQDPRPLGMEKKEEVFVPVKEMPPEAIKEATSGEVKQMWFEGKKYNVYPDGREELIK